jgi:hypothetical protein
MAPEAGDPLPAGEASTALTKLQPHGADVEVMQGFARASLRALPDKPWC